MTDNEIQEWLTMLAPTNEQRLTITRDLIRHANEDGMTPEDRKVCVRAILLLKNGAVSEAAGPRRLNLAEEVAYEQ